MRKLLCLLPIAMLLAGGCSHEEVDGVHVWGNATWDGKPIPSGMIAFTPDSSKGNTGHQGWAPIKDGRFDTRGADGKVVARGPTQAMIVSSQASTDPSHSRGTEIVLRHTLAVEIPAESGELAIEVPGTVKAVVSFPDGSE